MEKVPLSALKNLYLSTDDGKVLEIKSMPYEEMETDDIHLYQQFNPVTTRVASKLEPYEFIRFLTDPGKPIFTPKLCFVELQLNELAHDANAPLHNLPYPNPDHLRDCLIRLKNTNGKQTKTVLRYLLSDINFRTVKNGFFIGEQENYLYYPFPSHEELESKYHSWWRSALTHHF